jgi:hypothetical protein
MFDADERRLAPRIIDLPALIASIVPALRLCTPPLAERDRVARESVSVSLLSTTPRRSNPASALGGRVRQMIHIDKPRYTCSVY